MGFRRNCVSARAFHAFLYSVIFIDEIDGVLGTRTEGDMSVISTMVSLARALPYLIAYYHDFPSQKTKILECWDGLRTPSTLSNTSKGLGRANWVLVIGATNRPWAVDPAVLRRMPRQILVDLPDAEGRADILRVLLRRCASVWCWGALMSVLFPFAPPF